MSNLTRNIWRVVYAATVKLLPQSAYCPPAKALRGFFARRICMSAGRDINIDRGATFSSLVTIGDRSGIGMNSELHGEVRIGDDVMMAPECCFYTRNHRSDRLDVPMGLQGETEPRPITIGDDVWIGRRVMFMPGVTIGDHCIVAAGAVVTKSFPPYTVLGGGARSYHRFAAWPMNGTVGNGGRSQLGVRLARRADMRNGIIRS